jgi:thiamine biosynthesis protein ThiS
MLDKPGIHLKFPQGEIDKCMEKASSLQILVNGSPTTLPGELNISELLAFLQVASERVAVELDKVIVRKRDWASAHVHPGSQVEIVEFVGGG